MVRFLIRMENKHRYLPKDSSRLMERAREAVAKKVKIGNLRVSHTAIEFDMFAEDDEIMKKSIRPLRQQIGNLLTVKLLDGMDEKKDQTVAIDEGVNMFNSERFWECHEVLENIWKNKSGDERRFLQGVILIAIAFVHYQKDEVDICVSILRRSLQKLEWNESYYYISILKRNVEQILCSGRVGLFRIERN